MSWRPIGRLGGSVKQFLCVRFELEENYTGDNWVKLLDSKYTTHTTFIVEGLYIVEETCFIFLPQEGRLFLKRKHPVFKELLSTEW